MEQSAKYWISIDLMMELLGQRIPLMQHVPWIPVLCVLSGLIIFPILLPLKKQLHLQILPNDSIWLQKMIVLYMETYHQVIMMERVHFMVLLLANGLKK